MKVHLVVPDRGGLGPSGGDAYDEAVVRAWAGLGRPVAVTAVAGDWPWPDQRSAAVLRQALAGPGPVLVDGLVACSLPEVVEEAAARCAVGVLVHACLSQGAGATGPDARELDRREARALAAARVVVATSQFAADELAQRYGVSGVVVARPGVSPGPLSPGSTGSPALLTLGAVTPGKNHALLLTALGDVLDLSWTATVVGPAPDPAHLRALRRQAVEHLPEDRVRWLGPLVGADLDRVWARTDLLVHPSRSESYGLVVAEAHAHGIPTIVGAGTGAVEALLGPAHGEDPRDGELPGVAVPTDDPEQLAAVLRQWLTQSATRTTWRAAATRRRGQLSGWDRTVQDLEIAVAAMTGR